MSSQKKITSEGTGSETQARSSWSGKWGFILAAAASAVGLGNLWRFPYLAARYGGGAFLLVYLILVVTFGFALMMGETALGRMTGLSTIGAFRKFGKKFTFIGVLASLVPFIITPYYCIIGGWVSKYMVSYLTTPADVIAGDTYFTGFILNNPTTYAWLIFFLACAYIVVGLGVQKGIERANKILMPTLIGLSIIISIYALTLPGALDGLAYYLIPDFSKMSVNLVVAAMGQMFFSLSLAMGIMVTYGSYLDRKTDLEHAVRHIEVFDTGIAFLAGLMIIPATFSVTGSAEGVATKAGPGLMFGVLPQVFQTFGPMGRIVGFLFFALVFFAALTSAISLFETCVSIVQDMTHRNRGFALVTSGIVIMLVAIFVNMGYNIGLGWDPMHSIFGFGEYQDFQMLDFFDFISNTILMPIVALLTCIFIGFIVKPQKFIDSVRESSDFKGAKLFSVMIRYIAPICLVLIFVFYILNTMGIVSL